MSQEELLVLASEITVCRRCPRLVAWREKVAREKVARYAGETYWGRPVPGFGDPDARLWVLGLAPAAHGGNRTGRVFTGDRSGDFLFRVLYEAGFANQSVSVSATDHLAVQDLYISAAVRCAPPDNRPTPVEYAACRPFLAREFLALDRVRLVLALGAVAYREFRAMLVSLDKTPPPPFPPFAHGRFIPAASPGLPALLASYHPSARNTQTGLLTPSMMAEILQRARKILAAWPNPEAETAKGPIRV